MISDEKISFSVKKLPRKKKILFTEEEEKVEKEYITQIVNGKFEGCAFFDIKNIITKSKICFTNRENTKNDGPLIIPLIKKNEDENNVDNKEEEEEKEEEVDSNTNDIMDENKYGLVKKGKKRLKKGKSKPILLKKKKYHEDADENFKGELNDLTDIDLNAYEKIPVEKFGEALLRGMGWDPNSKENIKFVEGVKRPQRLGLGASVLFDIPKKNDVNKKN